MIFDHLGLPKDNGASDLQDSARLAGLLAVFEYPGFNSSKMTFYLHSLDTYRSLMYVRHPEEHIYDFSRDQYICLAAGLSLRYPDLVDETLITGRDWLSPSVNGHTRRCQGRSGYWFQNLWLKMDILFHAKFTPLSEPNQVMVMAYKAEPKYLKLWTDYNKQWRESIRLYWCNWRNEPELSEHIIKKIEARILN